jgi:hypothetical protein
MTTTIGQWPTDEDIRALARNEKIQLFAEAYEIAHEYHRISEALADRLLGTENLNWCGFAQWSSKAVGSSLRLGNHSGFLRKLGRLNHVPMLAEPLFRRVMLILLGGSYSVGLSTANRSIFVEMASFHTHLLADPDHPTVVQVRVPDPDGSLLKDLGEPGLDLLRTARGLLNQAGTAPAPLRSELMLGASIALSAYEQDRVQPALEFVFYRPVRWLLQVTWRLPWYYLTGTSRQRQRIYRRPHPQQSRIMQAIEDRWVRMYSRTLWIKTAVDTIMLSQPLTVPRDGNPGLLRPAATFQAPEVTALVARYGPADPGALKGVANWLDYDERMRFIVAYFMGYQQVPQMFGQPRYKRSRAWLKPSATEPLDKLEFRTVPL